MTATHSPALSNRADRGTCDLGKRGSSSREQLSTTPAPVSCCFEDVGTCRLLFSSLTIDSAPRILSEGCLNLGNSRFTSLRRSLGGHGSVHYSIAAALSAVKRVPIRRRSGPIYGNFTITSRKRAATSERHHVS